MAYPATVMANGIMTNIYRILNQSENAAMIMLVPNATTQGGTEYSWVLIGLWPNDRIMVGEKYAYASGQDVESGMPTLGRGITTLTGGNGLS